MGVARLFFTAGLGLVAIAYRKDTYKIHPKAHDVFLYLGVASMLLGAVFFVRFNRSEELSETTVLNKAAEKPKKQD